MRIDVVYMMYFASGARDSGSTKLDVTPAGGVKAGILERSIPAKEDMLATNSLVRTNRSKKEKERKMKHMID